jgi:hypothetical protein
MAGTGKTTIAYSLCEALRNWGLFGASFFCSRNAADCSNAENIPPSIAYQLSQHSSPFLNALVEALDSHNGQPGQNITVRFERTLEQPLRQIGNRIGAPLIVVIDALDECSEPRLSEELISCLWRSAATLPIKFFLTGRPESHFRCKIYNPDDISLRRFHLHDVEKEMVKSDIHLFIQEQLGHLEDKIRNWKSLLESLVDYADRLFICAATASKFILEAPDGFQADRLESIVLRRQNSGSASALHHIYSIVMDATCKKHSEKAELDALYKILRTIVCLRNPLSVQDLALFINMNEEKITGLLSGLHSVVSIPQGNGPVQPLHASFPEYLLASTNHLGGTTPSEIHALLAESSFRIMNEKLEFNIAKFPTSYQANIDIPLSHFLESIGPSISYASLFWGHHLQQSRTNQQVFRAKLVDFFVKKKLLFWLEVLSVLQSVNKANPSLYSLVDTISSTSNLIVSGSQVQLYSY